MNLHRIVCVGLMLVTCLGVGCEKTKCQNISDGMFKEVVIELVVYPDTFQAYMENESEDLSDIYFRCLEKKITDFENLLNAALDECNRKYLEYSEEIEICRNSAYGDYGPTLRMLYAMEGFSYGAPTVDDWGTLNEYIYLKTDGDYPFDTPEQYEEAMLSLIEMSQTKFACDLETCEDEYFWEYWF